MNYWLENTETDFLIMHEWSWYAVWD